MGSGNGLCMKGGHGAVGASQLGRAAAHHCAWTANNTASSTGGDFSRGCSHVLEGPSL